MCISLDSPNENEDLLRSKATTVYQSQTPSFREELQTLLNKHGMDSRVEMPDFFLAEFLTQVLVDMEHMNRGYRRWKESS